MDRKGDLHRIRFHTKAIANILIPTFVILAGSAVAQEMPKVADGDFESPVLTSDYQYNLAVAPGQPWTFAGHSGIARESTDSFHVSGPSSNQFGFLQSPNSSFSQTIRFPVVGEFTLSYSVAGRTRPEKQKYGGNLDYIISITAIGSDKPLFSSSASTKDSQPFKPIEHRFSIPMPGNYVLSFRGAPGTAHDDSALFDNITLKSAEIH